MNNRLLTSVLREFCEANNLPQKSADELLAETSNPVIEGWLSCFLTVWEAMEDDN